VPGGSQANAVAAEGRPRGRVFRTCARRRCRVVEAGRELWAVEVKAARSVHLHDTRGLEAFSEHAGRVVRQAVVFLGPRRQRLGKVEAIPLHEFLAELPA